MKKFLALILAAVMALGICAASAEITTAFLNNPVSDFRFGQPADIQKDLGGKDVALMFICNRLSFMLPLAGSYYYPKRFYYNNPDLKAYRKELTALLDKMN